MNSRLAQRSTRRLAAFAILLAAGFSFSSAQEPPPAASRPALAVAGETVAKRSWTLADLAALPQIELTAADKEGNPVVFRGVSLTKILQACGAPLGEQLHGPALSLVLLVKGADGYQAAFALAELDPAITDKQVLLAVQADGQPLAEGVGPLRLIIPDEKRHARWVRDVTALEVVRIAQ